MVFWVCEWCHRSIHFSVSIRSKMVQFDTRSSQNEHDCLGGDQKYSDIYCRLLSFDGNAIFAIPVWIFHTTLFPQSLASLQAGSGCNKSEHPINKGKCWIAVAWSQIGGGSKGLSSLKPTTPLLTEPWELWWEWFLVITDALEECWTVPRSTASQRLWDKKCVHAQTWNIMLGHCSCLKEHQKNNNHSFYSNICSSWPYRGGQRM